MNYYPPMHAEGALLEPMARRLEYHGKFSSEDRAAILALPCITRSIEKQHFVVRDRELTSHVCLLLAGTAVRSKIVATGARQIVAIHMKGDMVDLQNAFLKVADHSVEMITAGRIAVVPKAEIERIALERPAVGKAMWLDTLVDASIFREWVANVGRRDARTRIAHLLCEFALRMKVAGIGEQNGYELPMTQEQIGDATGLTSVHVNRTLRSLEADGLIERAHARKINIGDWRKLAEVGDFDSNYLHLHRDEPALN